MDGPGAFARLTGLLEKNASGAVVIQTHDFPDHDAAAAAFGLGELLRRYGYEPALFYRGIIRSHSLQSMISGLGISLVRVSGMVPEKFLGAPCVIVDGNPVNTNARQVTERLFGVVDHHPCTEQPPCPFIDIRPGYGSCASIVADYWQEAGQEPDEPVSTALLMGIEMDTDFLSRRVSRADLDALYRLFFRADWQSGARILKASLSKKDLPAFDLAITNARIRGKLFFTLITVDTSQEVISILADLFLRLREIAVSVIIENQGSAHHVSVRSRDPAVSAVRVIRRALQDIGEGGGHDHMAGGLLNTEISEETLFQKFVEAVDKEEHA
jgi:nanoRNase/pAp phosphatase (c-di-AMP/oligoRNAs hydrolase)